GGAPHGARPLPGGGPGAVPGIFDRSLADAARRGARRAPPPFLGQGGVDAGWRRQERPVGRTAGNTLVGDAPVGPVRIGLGLGRRTGRRSPPVASSLRAFPLGGHEPAPPIVASPLSDQPSRGGTPGLWTSPAEWTSGRMPGPRESRKPPRHSRGETPLISVPKTTLSPEPQVGPSSQPRARPARAGVSRTAGDFARIPRDSRGCALVVTHN